MRRLWVAPVERWAAATELPLKLREALDREHPLPQLAPEVIQQSSDGTRKHLWRLADGEAIESVLIPSGGRQTLCISSQAGCALRCAFCATGRMGYRRNLTPFEIAGQVREIVLRTPDDQHTNIVFMGMGEPLLNWEAVDTALTVLNAAEGSASARGISPSLPSGSFRDWRHSVGGRSSSASPSRPPRHHLRPAPRHHADREEVRSRGRAEGGGGVSRRVTFEYVMIGGVNDADADADRLAKLARRLGALVNILPLHPGGAPDLTPTAAPRIRAFADRLRNQGIEATVRRSRGLDISAACGQLRVEVEKKAHRREGGQAHGRTGAQTPGR